VTTVTRRFSSATPFTAHVAQGTTVDAAYVLATDAAYREWAYVALSRARDTTRLYASAEALGLPPQDCHDPLKTQAAPARRLERTQAQTMAVELSGETEPPHYITDALGRPPDGGFARSRWDRASAEIERYRDTHDIDDSHHALAPRPDHPATHREWLLLQREINRVRQRTRTIS
jgi:hypothetical protein